MRLDPHNPEAYKDLAVALAENGRLDGALAATRKALALRPRYFAALYLLAQLKRFSPGDEDLMTLEALARDRTNLGPRELTRLYFTLAKAYEDVGDFERSFSYLREANARRRRTFRYDVGVDVTAMLQIEHAFGVELFKRFSGAGSDSTLPVLVVGMPRSGTSLVEQVLASHPGVVGGGELGHLDELARALPLLSAGGEPFPAVVGDLRRDDVTRIGHGYVRRLQQVASDAARVTDKNPLNFLYLGFAALIAPQARVVHCMRDPLDTCLSCYTLDFEDMPFAFDLRELGIYYRAYLRLMEHWRTIAAGEWMLEVSYEDLVTNLEEVARRIVGHCGLEWDDTCLAFQKTTRSVQTASFAQVRQPIYGRSVGRAKPFRPYLGELLAALDSESG